LHESETLPVGDKRLQICR